MAEVVMLEGEKYGSVKYYYVMVWSCIIFVKD